MRAYELKRNGHIVHVLRSTTVAPDGREEHLTRGRVGRAGEVFTNLPPHVTESIDAGEQEDIWNVIDIPEPSETPVVALAPAAPADYEDMDVRELMTLATQRGLDVEGSGAGGNVLKADLVSALEADDEEG